MAGWRLVQRDLPDGLQSSGGPEQRPSVGFLDAFGFWMMVLAGSDLLEHLDVNKSVGSRVWRRVELDYNTPQRMLEYLGRLHPDLAQTDEHLLRIINDTYGDGNWRAWGHLVMMTCGDQDRHLA